MAGQHTVTGLVNKDGSILGGTGGFIVDRVDTGIYSVIFTPPFLTTPVVVTSQVFPNDLLSKGGNTRDNSLLIGVSHDRVRIKTGNGNGDADNRVFTFIAMGVGPAAEDADADDAVAAEEDGEGAARDEADGLAGAGATAEGT
jgi:hypothetical protein